MIRKHLRILPALALAACATDLALPVPSLDGLPPGLDVAFTVTPDAVQQGEAFTATLTVTNTTPEPIRVVTAHGCLAVPHVLLGSERVPLAGSWWACTAAITTHTFAPGETVTRAWEMRAELYAQDAGDVDGAPAPRGTYRVQAEFDTLAGNGGEKPAVERILRVR